MPQFTSGAKSSVRLKLAHKASLIHLMGFSPPQTKRYSAKRNKTLFRTRKLNKHKVILPFAMFKDQKDIWPVAQHLPSDVSLRKFPAGPRTPDPEDLKGNCI